MTRDSLIGLSERCEAASGPDRELDHAIRAASVGDAYYCGDKEGAWACAACWPKDGCRAPMGISDERTSYPNDWRDDERLPAYSASVDAALSLAEGYGGEVTFFKDGTAKAFVWQPYPLAIEAKAASPALALCAAALRARASTEQPS